MANFNVRLTNIPPEVAKWYCRWDTISQDWESQFLGPTETIRFIDVLYYGILYVMLFDAGNNQLNPGTLVAAFTVENGVTYTVDATDLIPPITMYTEEQLRTMYNNGLISYWDYAFCAIILNVDYTVVRAIEYANRTAPGGFLTSAGRSIAIEILNYQGRPGEIADLPGGNGKASNIIIPLALGAALLAIGIVATRRRKGG